MRSVVLAAQLLRSFFDPTPAPGESFGDSVAAHGGMVLLGSPGDDSAGPNAGAAYLVDPASGVLLVTYQSGIPYDTVGGALASAGDRVLVGAPAHPRGANSGVGVAYVFAESGPLLKALRNPSPDAGDYFGVAVAVRGTDFLVGGAIHSNDPGEVYVFRSSGRQALDFDNPEPGMLLDYFGASIAVLGDDVVVGASQQEGSNGARHAGAAYLFDGSNGRLLRTYQKPTPTPGDFFGVSVAVVGDKVVVGASYDGGAGAVYVFDAASGALLSTLHDPTPAAGDEFGLAVAALGEDILVSAHYDDTAGPDAGAAFLFDGATGALEATFLNPTPDTERAASEGAGDLFGWSLCAVPDGTGGWRALVGAPWDDTRGEDAGAAYLFSP